MKTRFAYSIAAGPREILLRCFSGGHCAFSLAVRAERVASLSRRCPKVVTGDAPTLRPDRSVRNSEGTYMRFRPPFGRYVKSRGRNTWPTTGQTLTRPKGAAEPGARPFGTASRANILPTISHVRPTGICSRRRHVGATT